MIQTFSRILITEGDYSTFRKVCELAIIRLDTLGSAKAANLTEEDYKRIRKFLHEDILSKE